MSVHRRTVHASVDRVWSVLADGWLYPLFVVGASRMRDVDPSWPAPGSALHHSVGSWPLLIDDSTSVVESDPPTRIRLRARAWPAGEADVTFHLQPRGVDTEVVIEEDAASGPAVLVPRPLRAPLLDWRNSETLRRLAYVVEGRTD
ncbi:SRPBCC family protein (plasmid) [Georgenia sp. TF02-10]|uniref:SRPBCC family protein n=1 Tax=Georgenia sp. TF02-10 TaxID=2917725 RepID=UPI001FA70814|nr:SRPBCC family protein [Georgenia sp. TF02-10]UNX56644.1 SRPBCC family protein [Georgenia sp. TF02-10]